MQRGSGFMISCCDRVYTVRTCVLRTKSLGAGCGPLHAVAEAGSAWQQKQPNTESLKLSTLCPKDPQSAGLRATGLRDYSV